MFACLYLPPEPASGRARASHAPNGSGPDADLASVAREFSPRVETSHPRLVLVDVRGLDRLIGEPETIGRELRRAASERNLPVHVALASTGIAAALMARARAGLTVVPPGEEASALATLPLRSLIDLAELSGAGAPARGLPARGGPPATASPLLPPLADGEHLLEILTRWGLETLGDLAALPPAALSERLGQGALAWQRAARGEDSRPLAADRPEDVFEESMELEWPIEGLEPLSFVLGRLLDSLAAKLERSDRGAAVIGIELRLVTRETFERRLELPAAMRDPRVLRALILLDLESHPVPAGIDAVTVRADVVPGRILHYSLLTRPLPSPERVSTLVARLTALAGESRAGSPVIADTHQPGAFTMTAFAPRDAGPGSTPAAWGDGMQGPPAALRRFRIPVPARVVLKDGRPDRVVTDRRGLNGGEVRTAAGPWRTSGEWWDVSDARLQVRIGSKRPQIGWNRDEWDVSLTDGGVYRIYLDRDHGRWFVDGIVD